MEDAGALGSGRVPPFRHAAHSAIIRGVGGDTLTCWRLQPQANRRLPALAMVLFASAACASGVTSAQEAEPESSRQQRQYGSQSANRREPSGESQNRSGRDSYADWARATGGFSYNGPHEYLAEATKILFSVMDPDAHSLAWVTGSVASSPAIEIPVVVDSTVKQLDFVVSTHANESVLVELRRPDPPTSGTAEKD